MYELTFLDAVAQAALVRRGEVSPRELVLAAIERIERLNPALNAVVTPRFEAALEDAGRVRTEAPLAGVPILLKDLVATCAGVRHTEGSAFLAEHVAVADSELVARFRLAGLVVVGVANTAEFGNASTTEPHLFGATRNPWSPSRTPGGSSGGSAAAVAAGMVPLAHGNDGGGSIRIPASCCGLFGLKPTRGRNPLEREVADLWAGLVVEHALTRSVRDSGALLDAVAGPFPEDAGAHPARMRIAFRTETLTGAPVHPDCAAAARDAAALCAELGHEVEEAAPDLDAAPLEQAWFDLWADGNAGLLARWEARLGRPAGPDELEPLTRALCGLGAGRSAADRRRSLEAMRTGTRCVARFFERYDAWITPTLAQPPVALGALEPPPEDPLAWIEADARFAPFTALANATGQPAMSVPLSWNRDGLPIGAHVLGRLGEEATLLRLAAQLEAARPWTDRRPPAASAKIDRGSTTEERA